MHRKSVSVGLAIFLISSLGLSAAGPATKPVIVPPLDKLASLVVSKSANHSVVLIIRPDTGSSTASPGDVARLRDAVTRKLHDAGIDVAISPPAETVLRDALTVGRPTMPVVQKTLASAKTEMCLVLCIRRTGDLLKVASELFDTHGPVTQLVLSLDNNTLPAVDAVADGTDDLGLALKAVADVANPVVATCVTELQKASIKSVQLVVRPETPGDVGTAGFESAVADAVKVAFTANQVDVAERASNTLANPPKPASIAKLTDLPEDAAVVAVTYSKRPAGRLLKFTVLSSKVLVTSASTAIDEWDAAAFPPFPYLNTKVLSYSESQKGKKVGNGECWTLAAEALKDAKAHGANGYTYGRQLAKGAVIFPGDIIQFTSAKFEGHSNGGSWWVQMGFPNHTAVVRRVLGPTRYEILQQNPGPVNAATIDFKDLKSGTFEFWRAVPNR